MRLGPDLSRRSNEPELLDGAHCPPDEVVKSLSDLRFVNRWFSARGRLLREVARHMPPGGRLLDVGCGSGDVAAYLQSRLSPARWKRGGPVRAVGVDLKPLHLRHAPRCLGRVAADVWRLPFRDASFDVVTASLFLHHFADGELARLLRELARLARRAIVVSDLERARRYYRFVYGEDIETRDPAAPERIWFNLARNTRIGLEPVAQGGMPRFVSFGVKVAPFDSARGVAWMVSRQSRTRA